MELPKITHAFFNVTDECPLRCKYCFVNHQPNYMTYQVAKDAVDFLYANSQNDGSDVDITFFGGEPLLMYESIIKPIAKYVRDDLKINATLSITTNGVLLTDEIMQFMKDYKIGILFSIDGDKETQDFNRPMIDGSSSFDKIEKNIDKIITLFPNTVFRSTIVPQTCHLTWSNIQFAIDHGYKTFFTTPNVFEEWSETDKTILANEMHKYSEYFVESYRNKKTPIILTSLELVMKRIKDINRTAKYDQYRTTYYCQACGKCGLGTSISCSISTDGKIYACQEITSNYSTDSIFYIGSIYDGVDDNKRQILMDSYDPTKVTGLNCADCKYNRICDGGCVANNYMINGDIHINPKMYCWWRQLLLSEAEWIIQTLGEEHNEMFRDYWTVINRDKR